MKNKLLLLFMCLSVNNNFSYAEEQYFYILVANTLVDVNGPHPNMIKWDSQTAANIPFQIVFDPNYYFPGELSTATSVDQFKAAYQVWSNNSPCYGFSETNVVASFDGNYDADKVIVQFTNDPSHFGGLAGEMPGFTDLAVGGTIAGGNRFEINPDISYTEYPRTRIWFNNTQSFNNNGFSWTNDNNSSAGNKFNFQTVALHEIGHVIGLAHAKVPNTSSVMFPLAPPIIKLDLTESDKTWVTALCNATPVGPPGSPPMPGGFTVTVSGSNVVLNWSVPQGVDIWGHSVYKNGNFFASLNAQATSYTDINGANALPAKYYVAAWNLSGESTTDPITIVGPATISSSGTWSGIVEVQGNAIINSGTTITIEPQTVIKIAPGTSIQSYGIILAEGNPLFEPIVFTSRNGSTTPGSWGSITFSGSGASGSNLNGVTIQYGTQISVINANNVTIQNCNINNVTQGIYFSGSSNSSVINNTLTSSTIYHGIRFENGSTGITCIQNTSLNSFLTLCA